MAIKAGSLVKAKQIVVEYLLPADMITDTAVLDLTPHRIQVNPPPSRPFTD